MTKLTSKIVTGIAMLGLAAPVFATPSASSAPAQTKTAHAKQHRTHKKVAAAEQGAATEKSQTKTEAKKGETKTEAKHHGHKAAPAKAGTKAESGAPAPAPAAPATK